MCDGHRAGHGLGPPLRLTMRSQRTVGAVRCGLPRFRAAALAAGTAATRAHRRYARVERMGRRRQRPAVGWSFDVAQERRSRRRRGDGDAVMRRAQCGRCDGRSLRLVRRSNDHVGDAVDVDAAGGDVGRPRRGPCRCGNPRAPSVERSGICCVDASVRTPARSSCSAHVGAMLVRAKTSARAIALSAADLTRRLWPSRRMHALSNAFGRRGTRRHSTVPAPSASWQPGRGRPAAWSRRTAGLALFGSWDDALHRTMKPMASMRSLVEHEGLELVEPHLAGHRSAEGPASPPHVEPRARLCTAGPG